MSEALFSDVDLKRLERDVRKAFLECTASETRLEVRRVELGKMLLKARSLWPERGPNAKGWGEFLGRVGMEQPTAWRYMKYAGYVVVSCILHETGELPTYVEAGVVKPQTATLPDDGTMPRHHTGTATMPDDPELATPLQLDQPKDERPNSPRNSWCTPVKWTSLLGRFDLDPCSNERSTIQAACTYSWDRGEDGLDERAATTPREYSVFVNPPYGRGHVIRWVHAYRHTRFCFLLKFDPSTQWFEDLLAVAGAVLIPRERVAFESSPLVEESSNQFPHAFFYAREEDIPNEMRAPCFPVWRIR